MSYVPNTPADQKAMLDAVGVGSIGELFGDVPERLRYPEFSLPAPLSEMEVLAELREMSERNADLDHYLCFLGAGAYNHFLPSVVDQVISRSEFYTAYTPYQPEISQGTLQTIFEYQSMICALTGMDVANASHYDGATALAEAVIMAFNVSRQRKTRVVLSPDVHPEYREVVCTYTQGMGLTIVGDGDPANDVTALQCLVDDDTCCVVVQNPNFFGHLSAPAAMQALADAAHAVKALFVVVADPISLGLFKPPGDYGADVVLGEGQPLGNALNFGGPYLGYFACRQDHVRRMSGRLVGETVDSRGQRGYVMTLVAREQHIRRERATSNICTNQALNALAAGVYLAAMGRQGLRQVAELSYHKAHYAAQRIAELPGFELADSAPFFKEFAVRCPLPVQTLNRELLEGWGIVGGFDLGRFYPHREGQMLLCVTEMNAKEEIDYLIEALAEIAAEWERQEGGER
ncbi:MAG: aminomethyl-transferring glycine dehydrogenase subunit GcvPA [Anaerolineae bacterium]|nr:MAG: aminomethyl-transferring glycine dehydrogenase subunit GcvPA [Anaerolineae bacterium]